jgi:hypothetical protein
MASSRPLPQFNPDRPNRPGRGAGSEAAGQKAEEFWALPHPFPTTLLALWPGSKPPLQETVAEAFIHASPESVFVGEMSSPPEGALWTLIFDVPGPIDSRLVVFAEPAESLEPGELDEACRACRWVIGVELLLPPERLLRSFVTAMRLAAAVSPDAPAILDVASSTWHTRDSLDRWFTRDDADPPEWMLWTAHAACRDREYRPGQLAWIRTSGMWRCGLPELEIIDLPTELVQSGVTLVHAVAELLLESPPPQPGVRWSIGHDIDIALVPWQIVVPQLPEESPASLATRRLDAAALRDRSLAHPFGGVRAVICDPQPRGTYAKLWTWPETVLRKLADGAALLQQSDAGIRRSERLAQRTLPALVEAAQLIATSRPGALADRSANVPHVLVAASFERSAQGSPSPAATADGASPSEGLCEHLWLRLERIDDDSFHGVLVNDAAGAVHLRAGVAVSVPRSAVSDWQVFGGGIVLTPDEGEWLVGAVRDWLR